MLPLEPFSGEVVTPELVKDHLAICTSGSTSAVVTLSGLRGNITSYVSMQLKCLMLTCYSGALIIQSTIPTTSRTFTELLKVDSQAATLAALPPLPSLSTPTKEALPSFAILGSATLPLPPRLHKPPLPPRPGASSASKVSGPRLANPFASFFGRPSTPVQNPPPSPSTPASLLPGDDSPSAGHIGVDLLAHAIGRRISDKGIGKELSTLIDHEIKARLSSCPKWVVNRVIE